jgi:hypothetical protein
VDNSNNLTRLVADYLDAKAKFRIWREYQLLAQLRRYVREHPIGPTDSSPKCTPTLPDPEFDAPIVSLIRP